MRPLSSQNQCSVPRNLIKTLRKLRHDFIRFLYGEIGDIIPMLQNIHSGLSIICEECKHKNTDKCNNCCVSVASRLARELIFALHSIYPKIDKVYWEQM